MTYLQTTCNHVEIVTNLQLPCWMKFLRALNVLAEGDQNFTAEIEDNKFKGESSFITVRTSSCGKVMFSQASVILSTGGGEVYTYTPRQTPPQQTPTPGQPPPSLETGTAADGTHPIGINCILVGITLLQRRISSAYCRFSGTPHFKCRHCTNFGGSVCIVGGNRQSWWHKTQKANLFLLRSKVLWSVVLDFGIFVDLARTTSSKSNAISSSLVFKWFKFILILS